MRYPFEKPDDPRFAITDFVVEANSFEKLTLWERWHEEMDWESDSQGTAPTIGTIDVDGVEMPVVITIFWATLDMYTILFYNSCSMVTHHQWVEDWVMAACENPTYDNGHRMAHTDAMNFAHVINMIRREQKGI